MDSNKVTRPAGRLRNNKINQNKARIAVPASATTSSHLMACQGLMSPALKLIGVGAEAAANAAKLKNVTAGLREVSAEAASLRASANTTSKAFDAAVADLRVKLEAAIPGAKFTDDDIIGLAIGDRKSRFGQSAAAQRIRTDIGRTISKNKSLADRVKKLTAELDELPDDVAGIEKLRSRPVGGAIITGSGYAAQGVGTAANAVANFLDEEYHTLQGNSRRRLVARGARFLLNEGGITGGSARLGIFAGATYLASGDILGAAVMGIGGVGVGQFLRPEVLRQFGAGAAQAARIQKVVGQNISAGRRYGESSFLRGAIDLEKQATELQKKVVRVPGKPLTAAEQAMIDKANMLVDDATKLRAMHASGLEDALRNTGRVVWEDGVVAGTTGGVIAALNDSDAFGAGVGMGMGFSGVLRAANRAYQLFPKPSEPVYARSVLGDVATIVAESKDPAQRGYILEFLAKAGDDEKAQIQRAGIIRDLHMSTRGRVKFVKSGEFEAATILTASPEAEARIIMAEAQALHPGDEVKAKAYAKQRQAQLAEARAATNRVTALTDDSNTNKARIDQMKQSLQGMDKQIAEQQKIVDAERTEWKDIKTVDANRIKLDRMLQARSELEANLKVADEQQLLIDGDLSEAKGKAKVEAPMRPYEQRALPDGSTVRSASNAFYIVDGPQGKNVYVNIDTVDNIGAISEGWHALLSDSAVEALMPDMVNMMWGNQARTLGGRMAVVPEVTEAILDAYMADMSPEQAAKYKSDLEAGKRLYMNSNGKDTSGLIEPTREAMTWILSAMDLDRRVGYRPGLSTREGAAASVDGRSWATVKKTLFGERTLSDNVEKGLKNLLDPAWGLFARNHAENIIGQLQQAGMRFVESGDGTLRGYFFNSNNEIIRSPVLDKFYDRVISLTGGKGSLRVRPVNLYDPLIPLDQRIEFIKRNGMDWALNEKGTDILPPLEAAQKADGFARAIEDTLNGVPEDQRGMQVYTDDNGKPVRTGIPSPAELAAIAADPRIPATYKENLLTIMRTLGSGESKAVLSGEYSNVFSMNVDNVTEHRLRIVKDIAGKTETRNIIPLAFTMGEAPIYDAKGKKVRIPGPDGKMMDATQRVIRVHGFDINAFTNSKNHAFQQGLFVLDDAGKRVYLKDPKGNQYTAAYINELFGSEAEFMNKATLWMQRYYAHGPLDPNSPTPRQPNGSPREVNPVSAEVLDPVNPERGAAMRDALRAVFGLESGKKRLGWVTENRTTNTANGMLTRGTNFPLTDFRLDQFGPMKPNGQSMFIDQIGVTSGQYVMSLKGWGSTKIQPIAGQAGAVMRTIVEVGDGKYLPGHELSVTEVKTHPTLPDVKLFIGTTTIAGGKPMKTLAYTLGDGRIVEVSTSNEATALKELRKKLIEREDAEYIDTILNQWRYNRDKPLEGTLAPKVESKGEVMMYEPVGTAKDFVSTLEGLYQTEGRDMPPSVRAIIEEVGLDAAVASGDSPEKIIEKLVSYADSRKNFTSTGDKYRYALEVLKEARDMVRLKGYGQRAAYNVPTKTLSMDSIRDTFGLTKERGTAQANIDNRLANGFFEISKEFAPDQFTNNKQYLEAVIDKLQEQMNAAENLESVDAYKAEKARIEPLMDAADRALGKLKNQMPELWAEQPAAPAPTTTAPEIIAAEAAKPVTRDVQPRAGEAPEAPYLPPEEVARIREFRVAPDGTITRVTEKVKSEYDRWRQRYEAIIKKRQQEAKDSATAAERERRIFFAEQNRRAQIEIDSEEQFAAQSRKRAQEIAARDAKEAARLQKEADQAQARADALRLNFERGMDAARAAADIKRVETNRLIEVALSSEQPMIAPGLLLVESNRLTVQPVRMAVATDTVRTPSVTTRTGIVYLKNLAGFEGQTQGHQQAFFNYLFAEQIGRGKAIATEAFRGPMAAQQGINLLNSRVWVAQNSGARLVRLYKNADKAAGKDLVTYKVYGANGMLIKQANDAQDAVEAIESLERRFINTIKQPLGPLQPEAIGEAMNQITTGYLTQPASGRPRGNIPEKESQMMQVEGFQRYLPAQPRR